jgi:amino acid transporter
MWCEIVRLLTKIIIIIMIIIIIIIIIVSLIMYDTHTFKGGLSQRGFLGFGISLYRKRYIIPINKILPNDLWLCLYFTINRRNIL